MAGPTTVEDYLTALPDDRRAALELLRDTIKIAAPDATESIAYQMPTFRTHERILVSYAAFKNHYSLFPASDAVVRGLGDELAPYLVGRGTVRFPVGKPIPAALVSRIVAIRLAENEAAARR
ncbi:MAG: DUF1801 domain-containing protein [Thermomicrobiales bacterium]|jgi:uncharacterized protein YdhG (YjbR/CyaY superfamily)|nr:MAG: DUF1801 domain-containing protein [Thermomicrobiales bacterium]